VARLAASFRPDVIQLNTIARPPAESSVQTVPPAALAKLAALFTPLAEIPQDAAPTGGALLAGEPDADALVALVRRHPASAEQLAGLSNRSVEAVLCTLKALAAQERIHLLRRDGVWFATPP